MKKALLIILISILSVIGAFGLAIGGMYIFGGFNEKVVYAEDLSFNQTEVVTAENFFLQVSTETLEVTRTKLRLETSIGGEDIIDFPEEITIGKIFRITPKLDKDGNIKGGNVVLRALYKDNATVTPAECKILIDVPIKSVDVKLNRSKLSLNGDMPLFRAGQEIKEVLKIYPENALVPYKINSIRNVAPCEVLDKKMFITLNSNSAHFMDEKNNNLGTTTEIMYSYNENNELVFDNTINIKASADKNADVKLQVYSFATYKSQPEDASSDKANLIKSERPAEFIVGDYVINAMTTTITADQNVKLNNQIKLYLNNSTATGDNLNLGVNLTTETNVTPSPLDYKRNIYLSIKCKDKDYNLSLKNSDGTAIDVHPVYGLNLNSEINPTYNNYYWLFNIEDFFAYYNYNRNSIDANKLIATLTYFDGSQTDGVDNKIVKTFKIVPTIISANNIEIKRNDYTPGETQADNVTFKIKSGERFNLNATGFEAKALNNATPTYSEIEFYIDQNQTNQISLVPTATSGTYKVSFDFKSSKKYDNMNSTSFSVEVLDNAITKTGDPTYTYKFSQNNEHTYKAEFTIELTNKITATELFKISGIDVIGETKITSKSVKFFEQNSDGETFSDLPYLLIGGSLRYYIDFEFHNENTEKHLRLKTQNLVGNATTLIGYGKFEITARVVYVDRISSPNYTCAYWLGTSKTFNVQALEELKTLTISKLDSADATTTTNFESVETYNEDDTSIHYLFITSNKDGIESLKRYKEINEIKIEVKQVIDSRILEKYPNIRQLLKNSNINTNSSNEFYPLSFLTNSSIINFEPVTIGTTFGYKIGYRVNKIYSIEIDGTTLNNIFEVSVYININSSTTIKAKFKTMKESSSVTTPITGIVGVGEEVETPTEEKDFLQVKIIDKIYTEAILDYNNGEGESKASAIELYARIDNTGKFYYEGYDPTKLSYYFTYNSDNNNKGLNSLKTTLTLADTSGINITGLYNMQQLSAMTPVKDATDIGTGKFVGGLSFYNFPVNKENDVNKGVIVCFKVESELNADQDFNCHYKYINGTFTKVLNNNLSKELYFKIYGIDFTIKVNNAESYLNYFKGFKDNKIKIFDNTTGIFTFTAKQGSNDYTNNIRTSENYKQLFKVNATGNAFFEINENYSEITILKDILDDDRISFGFYVSSSGHTYNQFNSIETSDGVKGPSFDRIISSAFDVNFNESKKHTFYAPSKDNDVVTLTYKGSGDKNYTCNLAVTQPDAIKTKYGILAPVSVTDNNTKTPKLTFLAVPEEYTTKVTLIVSLDGSDSRPADYYITVKPNSTLTNLNNSKDIDIGNLNEDGNSHFINAGASEIEKTFTAFKTFIEGLSDNNFNVSSCDFAFANKGSTTGEINATTHMRGSYNKDTYALSVYSGSLERTSTSTSKVVTVTMTFTFANGGKYILTKDLTVYKNLTMELQIKTLRSNGTITLNNEDTYILTEYTHVVTDDVASTTSREITDSLNFTANKDDNATPQYTKESFRCENFNPYFKVDNTNSEDSWRWLVNFGAAAKNVNVNIMFDYYVENYDYTITFALQLTLEITTG